MTGLLDHDAYIAAAPEALRPQLALVRDRLKRVLPDADEVMQYGMPGFTSGDVMIAGYGAFSKQCRLYVSKGAINPHSDDIAAVGLKASKTGVTFSPKKPIPDELITALALRSREDLAVRAPIGSATGWFADSRLFDATGMKSEFKSLAGEVPVEFGQ